MDYQDFSKSLLLHPGIVRIELLSEDIKKEIYDIEYSTENVGFFPVDPVGLIDVCSHDLKLILFCSMDFNMFTGPFMTLIDGKGEVVGHDILDNERDQYDSPDYIWLTSNLFFDMSLLTEYGVRCVMGSLPLDLDDLPKDIRPRVFYPSKATADMLNHRFGATGNICSTVLLGVNNVLF